ncbi:hypothetical protein CYA_0222 [Synechococcus sp. JA-3-3Ab]|nr:hypothetical protein CYA_0222 [Synechococcus sp. JA-3-3Ab]
MGDWLNLSKVGSQTLLFAGSSLPKNRGSCGAGCSKLPPPKPQILRQVKNLCDFQTAEHPGQFYSVGGMSVL